MHIYVTAEQCRLNDGSGAADNLGGDVIGVSAYNPATALWNLTLSQPASAKTTSCFGCSAAASRLADMNPNEVSMSKKTADNFRNMASPPSKQ